MWRKKITPLVNKIKKQFSLNININRMWITKSKFLTICSLFITFSHFSYYTLSLRLSILSILSSQKKWHNFKETNVRILHILLVLLCLWNINLLCWSISCVDLSLWLRSCVHRDICVYWASIFHYFICKRECMAFKESNLSSLCTTFYQNRFLFFLCDHTYLLWIFVSINLQPKCK